MQYLLPDSLKLNNNYICLEFTSQSPAPPYVCVASHLYVCIFIRVFHLLFFVCVQTNNHITVKLLLTQTQNNFATFLF